MTPRVVLLIEDNAMNMELASDLLESAHFVVLRSGRAEEGIAMAVARQPDVILMDLALPGMDGLEATRRLKEDSRTAWIPIVALTASVMRGDDNRALAAGCCGYIAKPIDTRAFTKTVAGFIGVRETSSKPRKRCVLVVDDELGNRELLEANLVGFGYEVDMACDGAEAIALLSPKHDLVMLDVMMSGIDGFETARRIRAGTNCSDIPICMVTALTGREQRLRAVECGANDFIAKPIDRMEVKIRTASLLKVKEAQDAIREYRTKLEAQNQLLEESLGQLERASALKDEFVQIASHDLKNPLTCIMGFASIVQHSVKPGDAMTDEAHQHLSRIVLHTETMGKIIKDFLDFQSMEDGRIAFHPTVLDLNAIALRLLEQNAGHAKRKGIELLSFLAPDLPDVFADESQIGQVVDNLLSNALKFSSEGGRVSIRTRRFGTDVFVEVSDAGPGIAEVDMPMLFVKYATLSNEPTGGESSTGLGLAICKKLIDLNGGEISGRNNDGEGATFWFKLPVPADGDATQPLPAAEPGV